MSGLELLALAGVAGGATAGVGTALSVAGLGLSALSAIRGGQAANSQAKFESRVALRQAEITKQRAERERVNARQSQEDFQRQQSAAQARRRALLGVSGVESGSGSPLLASEDFASEVALQALRLRSGGEARATRLDQAATVKVGEAGLLRTKGKIAKTSGFIRGGSLLLSGAPKIFDFGGGEPKKKPN